MKKIFIITISLILFIIPMLQANSLHKILEFCTLKVGMREKLSNYIIRKDGRIEGFNYELAMEFANYLNTTLKVIKVNAFNEMFFLKGEIPENLGKDLSIKYTPDIFSNNEVDILTETLTLLKWRENLFRFIPIQQNRQLVYSLQSKKVDNMNDMANKKLLIRKNTSFNNTADNLILTKVKNIIPVYTEKDDETCIKKILKKEADYCIIDANSFLLYKRKYSNLSICFAIGEMELLCWAVDKKNKTLQLLLKRWMEKFKTTLKFQKIWKKYYFLNYNDYVKLIEIK